MGYARFWGVRTSHGAVRREGLGSTLELLVVRGSCAPPNYGGVRMTSPCCTYLLHGRWSIGRCNVAIVAIVAMLVVGLTVGFVLLGDSTNRIDVYV